MYDKDKLLFDANLLNGKKLYHYTDTNGLFGILNSKEIWATNYLFLNDPSEHSYGVSVVKSVIQDLLEIEEHANLRGALESIFSNSPNPVYDRRYYLASFSEEEDSIIQWMTYGNSGKGVAVEFDINPEHFKEFNDFSSSIPPQLIKMCYDSDKQNSIAETIIKNSIGLAPVHLGLLCDYMCIKFKDRRYAHEKEWRVVDSPLFTRIDRPQNLEYREARGAIIDYRKISLEKIKGICMGPGRPQSDEYMLKQLFFDKLGDDPQIYKSSVPFR